MNKCIFIGNLTRDPELVTSNNGKNICRFPIAVNRNYRSDKGAVFINVSVFGVRAAHCQKFLVKGRKVAVSGAVDASAYISKQTKKPVATINLTASDIEFLTSKADLEGEQPVNPYSTPYPDEVDLPEDFTDVTDEEELPF